MRYVLPAVLLLWGLCGCDPVTGEGTLTFSNRHPRCTVTFRLNDESDHTVLPNHATTIQHVAAGGQELVFTTTPESCQLYTRQSDSPFDSGRNLCNAFVDPNKDTKFT